MRKYLTITGIIIAVVFVVIVVSKKKGAEKKFEIKLVQNTAIQNSVTTPSPKTLDDLLPPELQTDYWGTKFKYKIKLGRFMFWSAGPDEEFNNLKYGSDDLIIFEKETFTLDQKEEEIIKAFDRENSILAAEVLLRSQNKNLNNYVRKWVTINGYIINEKTLEIWPKEFE